MQNGSFRFCHFSRLIFSGVALVSLVTFSSPALQAQKPKPPPTAPATQAGGPEFKLRLQRNEVIVRVVVRDKKGRAVSGLRKQDFRIRDDKKPQVINGFSVDTRKAAGLPALPSAGAPAAKAGRKAVSPPAAPLRYLALYFDDLYSAMGSLVRSRDAAEKFIAGLPSSDRVAIVTSSGAPTVDFTDDRQKIHEALMKLRVNIRFNPKYDCPKISAYLAQQIVDYGDNAALAVVADEAVNVCHWPPKMANKENLRALAREVYDVYRYQSLTVLKNLEAVIDRMATLPGERQVMLVSDGFINMGRDTRVESLIDRALRERVTISALDGKGLAVNMAMLDVRRSSMPTGNAWVRFESYYTSQEVNATGTLEEIADGTGGQFFHGDNDLLSGMRKILLPPEVSYVLTFSPSELKPDGAFHVLKVTLAHGHGLSVQARKGYFAPNGQVSPEELARNDIREAMYSPYPIQGVPMTVQTEASKTDEQNEKIAVQAQLDIRNLPFEKKGDRSVDDVVFAVGLFDHDGKYVTGRQFTYALALKDDKRAEMEKRGLSLKTDVSAKVAAYNLRVVVRDSQGGKIAALSKPVEVPSKTSPPVAKQVAPSEPAVASGAPGGKTETSSKAMEVPSQTSAPVAKKAATSEQAAASGAQGEKATAANKAAAVPSPNYPPMATLDVAPGQGVASGNQSGETTASNKALAVPSRTIPPAALQVAPGDKRYFQAYRRADPITNWPLKKLRHQVPELKGLKPATDQSQLPEILSRVSANLQKFVKTFVDTSAMETVDETETYGTRAGWLLTAKTSTQKFRYLILAQREGGAFTLVEYRTDLRGQEERRQKPSRDFIKTAGFAAMPLFFGLLQQPWSRFRYLGRQRIGGTSTDVVDFAEHVDPAAVMGHFVLGEISVPLLVQGVAWIRPGDYQIVQMRTDLLAPLPPLMRMTAVAHYAEYRLQDSPRALWLPKEVDVRVELGYKYVFSNRHRYSDYRLFRVKSVIKTNAPGTKQR